LELKALQKQRWSHKTYLYVIRENNLLTSRPKLKERLFFKTALYASSQPYLLYKAM